MPLATPRKTLQTYMILGVNILDEIRQQVLEHRMTLVDLDGLARTKAYFQHTNRSFRWKRIGKAVELFDGELVIVWRKVDEDCFPTGSRDRDKRMRSMHPARDPAVVGTRALVVLAEAV